MADFYEVLGLRRQAGDDEIARAYRRCAMAYNPACHKDEPDQAGLLRRFKLASQAYAVLSNPKARAIYDLYGEEGVRHGGTGQQGIPGGLQLDQLDPNTVFDRFFGVDNPFQVIGTIDGVQNNQHEFFSHAAALPKTLPKCPAMSVTLPISLEDVYYGAMRRATWQCVHATAPGAPPVTTNESFEVEVKKGAKAGDTFTLKGCGNSAPGCVRGDVIVVLEELPHERFRREGDDVVVEVPITLSEALCGTTIVVKTMEGREMSLLIDEIVHPKYRIRISGQGLPRNEEPTAPRGDLVVVCATQFPGFLTLEQKSELRRILEAT